ncbi:ABC transporter ATP-binding protein [Anaerovorax odorimutans]|uniref:ABC transporter ATP-binding protein n=1 Tax=Anaerovorax odorimutans TaxID=109327 RepID=UPI00040862DE|nr:ABC transporter ATP-binding protein [Anaerovorax odorimutans]
MIQIRNLYFSYGDKEILKDINLDIQDGEILALLGPNGFGKSTLLRCFNAFLKPKSGQILLNGKNIYNQSRRWISRNIAFLPQNLDSVQHITVYELISMGRTPYKQYGWALKKEDKEKIEWALDYMNLQYLRDKQVDKLSGGERQRVWLAMIIAQDTKLILLDEPITYLDLKYQWGLMEIIKNIRDQYKKTFILVLHDLNQAMMVADRCVILKDGGISAQGKPDEVITASLLKDVYDISAEVCSLGSDFKKFIIPAKNSVER